MPKKGTVALRLLQGNVSEWGIQNKGVEMGAGNLLKSLIAGTLAAMFMVGCGTQERQAASVPQVQAQQEQQNSIIGGKEVESANWISKTVVFLVMVIDEKTEGTCTGVLVDRNLVLTAAHCVHGVLPKNIFIAFDTKPLENAEALAKSGKLTRAEATTIHPNYRDGKSNIINTIIGAYVQNGDLAVVKLAKNAPSDWVVSKLSPSFVDISQNDLIAAGYGKTISDATVEDNTTGILRTTTLRGLLPASAEKANTHFKGILQEITTSSENKFTDEQKSALNDIIQLPTYFPNDPKSDYLFVDQTGGSGICSGDSGSAAFARVNGENMIIGIASSVGKVDKGSMICSFVGNYTNTLVYKSWLEKTFASMKSAPAPAPAAVANRNAVN